MCVSQYVIYLLRSFLIAFWTTGQRFYSSNHLAVVVFMDEANIMCCLNGISVTFPKTRSYNNTRDMLYSTVLCSSNSVPQ